MYSCHYNWLTDQTVVSDVKNTHFDTSILNILVLKLISPCPSELTHSHTSAVPTQHRLLSLSAIFLSLVSFAPVDSWFFVCLLTCYVFSCQSFDKSRPAVLWLASTRHFWLDASCECSKSCLSVPWLARSLLIDTKILYNIEYFKSLHLQK